LILSTAATAVFKCNVQQPSGRSGVGYVILTKLDTGNPSAIGNVNLVPGH